MNDKKTKFYFWLIGKLEHRKMTLPEMTSSTTINITPTTTSRSRFPSNSLT